LIKLKLARYKMIVRIKYIINILKVIVTSSKNVSPFTVADRIAVFKIIITEGHFKFVFEQKEELQT
jgi:hypothetical protein